MLTGALQQTACARRLAASVVLCKLGTPQALSITTLLVLPGIDTSGVALFLLESLLAREVLH